MTRKILYGDDNEQMRDSLARTLKDSKLEIDLVSNPQDFISRARAGNYYALVTDLEYTPNGREGYEVLREVKHLPALKILYTGRTGFEYEAEALENGADYAVLNKNSAKLSDILRQVKGGEEK